MTNLGITFLNLFEALLNSIGDIWNVLNTNFSIGTLNLSPLSILCGSLGVVLLILIPIMVIRALNPLN